MNRLIAAVTVLALGAAAPVAAGDLEHGYAAYRRGAYRTAYRLFFGLAEQGNAQAQHLVGVAHFEGWGVPQDYAEAVNWYRRAVDQGLAEAQTNLGLMYREGLGVPQDYAEALRLFRLASAQGVPLAQNNLGTMYDKGQGVSQDYAEAVRWYRRAAAQGNALAQNNLGYMYSEGLGVPQDQVQAHVWYSLAAANSTDTSVRVHAARLSAAAAKQMTRAQMSEARKIARAFKPRLE